ncbi:o-succinylbenzoate synthase [Synechococcus sp. PCC 6312]|uniref:o-succinylbenzoate synthase n=1 Tax=Synechococcus sp. (strain ATCC 27167 / PCC 6312) TaxID=195253 RepID=UPI00029F0BCF|nr:o-succinylbenzoate synthase [Synechococcus sp. PCC 6312]AFY59641.1 o-succinylbenzoic acid synthetase [Synechococcus sp. PCC 6312]
MYAYPRFFLYQEPFCQPLKTHHGTWRIREGIYVRLESESGEVGFGEIAPLPAFGSEPIGAAWTFCAALPNTITAETIAAIPDTLPACQFGLSQAWAQLTEFPHLQPETLPYCGLLPAGRDLLTVPQLAKQSYVAWKWKIAVLPYARELEIFQAWLQTLNPETPLKIRLDANGGLNLTTARAWLTVCDRLNTQFQQEQGYIAIEFLEQPLPAQDWVNLQALSNDFQTSIALDETVDSLTALENVMGLGWRGLVVIKPVLMGAWSRLKVVLPKYRDQIVLSSALEGAIGRWGILVLAQELNLTRYALGLGVDAWRPVPTLNTKTELEDFWELALEVLLHKS